MVSIPLDRINKEARELSFLPALLTLIGSVLYGIGWVAAKVYSAVAKIGGAVWLGIAWAIAAVRLGWIEARKGVDSP